MIQTKKMVLIPYENYEQKSTPSVQVQQPLTPHRETVSTLQPLKPTPAAAAGATLPPPPQPLPSRKGKKKWIQV